MGVERWYNSVEFDEPVELSSGSSWVRRPGGQWSCSQLERDVVGKATSGRRGLWALMSWGPKKMLIRCNKESQHPAEWALGLRLRSPREQERQRDGHNSGVKILQFMFGLQPPLTRKPWATLLYPCNKVRGICFYKEVLLRLSVFVTASLLLCRCDAVDDDITIIIFTQPLRSGRIWHKVNF